MRWVGLMWCVVVAGCAGEDWAAFNSGLGNSTRGGLKAMDAPRRCNSASDCMESGAVCMIAEGQSQGTCMKPR